MQADLQNIVEPLLKWYQKNKRELPWRKDKDSYHVWISEIMLQQTRIEAVKSYYHRFMKELPTVKSLANIDEEELLKLWEGLGYYSRARNLKKAATVVMQQYDGKMPTTYQDLIKMPGIGEYTAGAIASICFNEKVTAVDGNVLRVISRVVGSTKDVLLPETKKEIEKDLKEIMPEQSGDFNEALMELGELVCLPNGGPECEKCPLQKNCVAYEKNLTQEIPVRIKKVKRKQEEKTVFLLMTESYKIAIEKRMEKGLLSGMYQLPNGKGYYKEEEMKELLTNWNLKVKQISFLTEAKHVFTHIDWYMKCYLVMVEQENSRFLWVSQEELKEKYPLPTAFQKCMKIGK
ncbi:MAG: A/G-specific adenine glycosylase [Clostridia bacterium]|nr:A/G-specific adenine glycosylase [Clostridia bacterium]